MIGEVTTNRRLSLVLCLFSGLTLRVSQQGRLSGFRGMMPSNLVINLPSSSPGSIQKLFSNRDIKLRWKCHSAETVLRHLSGAGKSRREGGKIISDLSPPTQVEGRVLFRSPITCCFQGSFVPQACKQDYLLLLAAASHRKCALQQGLRKFGPCVMF